MNTRTTAVRIADPFVLIDMGCALPATLSLRRCRSRDWSSRETGLILERGTSEPVKGCAHKVCDSPSRSTNQVPTASTTGS